MMATTTMHSKSTRRYKWIKGADSVTGEVSTNPRITTHSKNSGFTLSTILGSPGLKPPLDVICRNNIRSRFGIRIRVDPFSFMNNFSRSIGKEE